ncbi:putative UMP/CMP kinase-like [Capsicum annuum]|nr:putative UMP/CMP kinase-like [Capsicum annuum]
MANEDSPSFSLGISQIETQKAVHDSNQVLSFTPSNFDYTKLGFSENRSKQWNDPEKLKILREAFAAKNQVSDMQMEDQDKIEQIPKSPSEQLPNMFLLFDIDIMHRGTSKVISIATTNARDLRNILPSLTDNDAARVIGKLIAERSKESNVYAIAYEPGKNERIEGILGIILDTIQKNEIIFV